MKETLVKLSQIIESKHKNKVIDYINKIIINQDDEYLIDILDEIKNNIINNKFEYAYVGIIEIIDYLGLEESLYDIYKNYLDYIWEE